MTDAWLPWDSEGSWEPEDWPKPEGPSEWSLFRKLTEPIPVITDAAARAMEKGEPTDSLYLTFSDGALSVKAPMGVWDHVFKALKHEEVWCPECQEIMDVFRRVVETLGEEDEDDGTL